MSFSFFELDIFQLDYLDFKLYLLNLSLPHFHSNCYLIKIIMPSDFTFQELFAQLLFAANSEFIPSLFRDLPKLFSVFLFSNLMCVFCYKYCIVIEENLVKYSYLNLQFVQKN